MLQIWESVHVHHNIDDREPQNHQECIFSGFCGFIYAINSLYTWLLTFFKCVTLCLCKRVDAVLFLPYLEYNYT